MMLIVSNCCLTAHIVEAGLNFFGMETRNNVPTKSIPPQEGTEGDLKASVCENVSSHTGVVKTREIYVPEEITEEVWFGLVDLMHTNCN